MHEKHEMILEETYPSGAEQWNCPTCGRRMIIHWEPKFKRTVLEAGDSNASHNGFKGSSQMGDMITSSGNETSPQEPEGAMRNIDEARLAPWAAWLDEIGFENLWDSDVQ